MEYHSYFILSENILKLKECGNIMLMQDTYNYKFLFKDLKDFEDYKKDIEKKREIKNEKSKINDSILLYKIKR